MKKFLLIVIIIPYRLFSQEINQVDIEKTYGF